MKTVYYFLIIATLFSCQNNDWKSNEGSIRPIQGVSEKHYNQNDFKESKDMKPGNYSIEELLNTHFIEFGVKIIDNKLIIGESTHDKSYFELEDGKLEIINRGEFGGGLNFIPISENSDTIQILNVPIIFVFDFKGGIYFMTGIAHLTDRGGAIFELIRKGKKFSYERVMSLDSAPEAMTIYKNKILIAGSSLFTVIENFEKDNVLINTDWGSLYPNSIAVKNENEIFVGMRSGYSKISLKERNFRYFKYKK